MIFIPFLLINVALGSNMFEVRDLPTAQYWALVGCYFYTIVIDQLPSADPCFRLPSAVTRIPGNPNSNSEFKKLFLI